MMVAMNVSTFVVCGFKRNRAGQCSALRYVALAALFTSVVSCDREQHEARMGASLEPDRVAALRGDSESRQPADCAIENATHQLKPQRLEWPKGDAAVAVAAYSGLPDKTRAGEVIVDGLLENGIIPLASGSRGITVVVPSSRAVEARRIVRTLIRNQKLNATVVDQADGI